MGPCTGHGSGGTQISSAYNIRWQVSIPSFKCVTFGHVIHTFFFYSVLFILVRPWITPVFMAVPD